MPAELEAAGMTGMQRSQAWHVGWLRLLKLPAWLMLLCQARCTLCLLGGQACCTQHDA